MSILHKRELHVALHINAEVIELDPPSDEESDHAEVFDPENHVWLAFRVI